ncbi:tetratricopeptide repeat protein [Actinomadura graeca]|uniref:Tetratricopeptide repeat protein n=1 Tax=Actinomadura graeca TaxID=2750812 RepID=A0ABX8QU43_9ACTN|nr:tetratricopeptide repeat protein [Actinomadura graeca]QXJ22341.1 tetratricopeptide repeat protein [Actinomadura graeca]
MTTGRDGDAAGGFASALRALYEAAGRPLPRILISQARAQRPPIRLNPSSLSDWMAGISVPSDPRAVGFLVSYLQARVPVPPGPGPRPPGWWEELRASAWEERHANRGGRRRTRPGAAAEAAAPLSGSEARRFWSGVVPRQADCYQARPSAVRMLDEDGTGGCHVLTGTGGVGKTQIAAHFAREAWRTGGVSVLVWIPVITREAVIAGYAQAGVALADASPGDPDRAAERFLAWCETTEENWLVVLDDVEEPSSLRGLWPPHPSRGRTVVTTRRRDAAFTGQGRRLLEVELFTADEASAYLTAKLAQHGREDEPAQIDGLAGDLGHLPLALAQAAAFMIDAELDCAAYRERLRDRRRTLLDLVPDVGALPDDHHATVAATWSLSVERADRIRPAGLARPLLELVSMLDAGGVPAAALSSPATLAYLERRRGTAPVSPEDARDTLRTLHRLSLADHDPRSGQRSVRVHGLIQRATREPLPDDLTRTAVRAAADALLAVWPETERNGDLSSVLRANAEALISHAHRDLFHEGAHPVLFRMGVSLGDSGSSSAIGYLEDLFSTALATLGPRHPDTLIAARHLSWCRSEAGRPREAVTALRLLLEEQLGVMGPDHPETLATRRCLARSLAEAGEPDAALSLFRELIADQTRILGPAAPETLATRCNLARYQGEAGEHADAVAAFEELLEDQRGVFDADHPEVLSARGNLARWQGRAGDVDTAVRAFASVLEDHLRILGPNHVETLTTRNNLAFWTGKAGDVNGALEAFQALLDDELRILGADHPRTLTARANLARLTGENGDAAGAVEAFERLLEDRLRILGPGHPTIAVTREGLSRWRGRADPLLETPSDAS